MKMKSGQAVPHLFGSLKKYVNFQPPNYIIDNWVFRLHYRGTAWFFFISSLLVTSRQLIGEHIQCIANKGVPAQVINTYCFFTTTFSVVEAMDSKLLDSGDLAHPGVGPYGLDSEEPIVRHAYYQWVPYVLFIQGLMFHLTHLLWKNFEGGKMKYLVNSLKNTEYSFAKKEIKVSGRIIPSKTESEKKIVQVRKIILDGIHINKFWSLKLMLCEILNILHIVLQVHITDRFLTGNFMNLGSTVWRQGLDSSVDVLDEIFPKITKCTFHKYGPSGSIQFHDAMCVMALNIINDKIYTGLWFWFVFIFVCSIFGLVWRAITFVLYSRSRTFNKLVFANSYPGRLNPWNALNVSNQYSYTDWLFLVYLAKNIDALVFKKIVVSLNEHLDERKYTRKRLLEREDSYRNS